MTDINKQWHVKVEGKCPHEWKSRIVETIDNECGGLEETYRYRCIKCDKDTSSKWMNRIPAYDTDPAVILGAIKKYKIGLDYWPKTQRWTAWVEGKEDSFDQTDTLEHAVMAVVIKMKGEADGSWLH